MVEESNEKLEGEVSEGGGDDLINADTVGNCERVRWGESET